MFAKGTTLELIKQICRRLRIPNEQVFTEAQLKEL
jgi:hypothetical protein